MDERKWAGRSTQTWRRVRRHILTTSTVCHWCGHPGAQAVDHHPIPLRIALRTNPDLAEDPANLAPIHGVEGCPICPPRNGKPRRCNMEKGAQSNATPPAQGSRDW